MLAYLSGLFVWSALHVLWQGVALSLAFAWWLRTERSPAVRHQTAIGGLLILCLSLLANVAVAHLALLANARLGGDGALVAESHGLVDATLRAFDRSFEIVPALVVVWLLGVATGAARLAVGAFHLARVRAAGTQASDELLARVAHHAAQARLTRVPSVLVSAETLVPFVTGATTPLLVLPMHWPPSEEHDALMQHELAHVERGDTRTNALLRLVQTVFWFHPAVWYLANHATRAREEAADVLATSRESRRLALARALVNLESTRQGNAVALAATDGALVTRVRRLVAPPTSHTWSESVVLPFLAMLVVFSTGTTSAARFATASDVLAVMSASARVVPSEVAHITAIDPAGRFTLTLLNGRVARATVAGIAVARSAIHRHERDISLVNQGGDAVLTVHLDPRGSIRWTARSLRSLDAF